MKRAFAKFVGIVSFAALIGGRSAVASASEPGNDYYTPSAVALAGDWEVLVATTASVLDPPVYLAGSLSSHTDVDYILVTCGVYNYPRISHVKLGGDSFATTPLPGDFDIYLYYPTSSASFASGALGGTSPEDVDLSAYRRNTVVAKIIRYSGNTGSYYLRVGCTTW